MKSSYLLVLLSIVLFIAGCAETPTTPTETTTPTLTPPATPTTPEPTTPDLPEDIEVTTTGDIMIKDRVIEPTELTVKAGTEVTISIEGPTPHIIIVQSSTQILENFGTKKDGDIVTYTFEEPGEYLVRSMKVGSVRATVIVE